MHVSHRATILRHDTGKVANAIEQLGIRLNNTGFTRPGLHNVSGPGQRILGYAVTSQVRCSDPPMEGARSYFDLGDWWQLIEERPAPRVAVIQDVDSEPGLGAVLSDVHAHVLMALRCEGVVTNGAVRNVGALRAMNFPAFAGCIGLSHAYVHMVGYGKPVEILGVTVQPADLVYADEHGLIVLPEEHLDDIVRVMEERAMRESRLISRCYQGAPLSELRELVREL